MYLSPFFANSPAACFCASMRVGIMPLRASIIWASRLVRAMTKLAAAFGLSQALVSEKQCDGAQRVRFPEEPLGARAMPTLPAILEFLGSLKKPAQPPQSRFSEILPLAKPWPRSSQI